MYIQGAELWRGAYLDCFCTYFCMYIQVMLAMGMVISNCFCTYFCMYIQAEQIENESVENCFCTYFCMYIQGISHNSKIECFLCVMPS